MESTINTIEKAFIAEGLDITLMPIVDHLQNEKDRQSVIANYMIDVVVRALNNEGQEKPWIADYLDDDTTKYENVYYNSPSSGWSLHRVVRWYTNSNVSSHLSLKY